MANYYQVLGLTQDATLEDIKRAYRSLAKQYHSDKNKSDSATKLFQEIKRAYQILTTKCQEYDVSLGIFRPRSDYPDPDPIICMTTRENMSSFTTDINENMFLVIFQEAQRHHGVTPIDCGAQCIQLRTSYQSPARPTCCGWMNIPLLSMPKLRSHMSKNQLYGSKRHSVVESA